MCLAHLRACIGVFAYRGVSLSQVQSRFSSSCFSQNLFSLLQSLTKKRTNFFFVRKLINFDSKMEEKFRFFVSEAPISIQFVRFISFHFVLKCLQHFPLSFISFIHFLKRERMSTLIKTCLSFESLTLKWNFHHEGPRWWQRGQHSCLLLGRSEFESLLIFCTVQLKDEND